MADSDDTVTDHRSAPNRELSRAVWLLMSDLVLDHERRREVSEAVGLSFARARAVRRVAKQPMSMGDLASALGVDRPNLTAVVDDLERRGLVRRVPHPTDRRAKLVEATPEGDDLARQANDILATPPAALAGLDSEELTTLFGLLEKVAPPHD